MKEFQVLPTNEDFRNLSDDQIDLILYSISEDHREMELARKGLSVDSNYYDTSFDEEVWNKPVGDWEVLKDGHDPNDIARQVEELTKAEDLKNLAMKFDSLDEYNAYLEAGGKTTRETEVEQYINKQLAVAEEKAKRLQATSGKKQLVDDQDRPEASSSLGDKLPDIDKAAIDKSIALFNKENDDDDDDYTVL
jgi:hypothetical protein